MARLRDIDEHGVSRNVTEGILRVREAVPGEPAESAVDVWSTSIVLRAGHRILLQVTSSNFPRWNRDPSTGEPEESATTARVTRRHVFQAPARPSRIVVPVVPGRQEPTEGSNGLQDTYHVSSGSLRNSLPHWHSTGEAPRLSLCSGGSR
ncbi:CocE/NonD family hydrolase C-terminal non-catalytic domain-containing protein [Streptomyces sp. bgisy034]|uniref:CocE/NonD family hydrolase C-terminal non-catalytic domain-containing protein n=1 Tax=Streptomyces sp. bgisy034 TaxID=3413774 RepID=UPI003EBB5286